MKINIRQNLKETLKIVFITLIVTLSAGYVLAWTAPTQSPPGGNVSLNFGVPAGAVMAFDLASCPSGWTAYALANGRNIIGSGLATGATGATAKTRGQTGGEEKHVQTIDEMVAHTHYYVSPSWPSANPSYKYESNTKLVVSGSAAQTGAAGGDIAANIMDPYVVLTYCRKT